jgi:hypothetical protein
MSTFISSQIYRSFDIDLHVEVVTDFKGTRHSFYQIVTDDTTYTISELEGIALEKRIRKIHAKRGYKGVDAELFSFSFLCTPGKMH